MGFVSQQLTEHTAVKTAKNRRVDVKMHRRAPVRGCTRHVRQSVLASPRVELHQYDYAVAVAGTARIFKHHMFELVVLVLCSHCVARLDPSVMSPLVKPVVSLHILHTEFRRAGKRWKQPAINPGCKQVFPKLFIVNYVPEMDARSLHGIQVFLVQVAENIYQNFCRQVLKRSAIAGILRHGLAWNY